MIFTTWNIGGFINSFLAQFYNLFRWCITTLNSIYIGNFTLLEFNITLLILGGLLSIALTTIRSNSIKIKHESKKQKGGE